MDIYLKKNICLLNYSIISIIYPFFFFFIFSPSHFLLSFSQFAPNKKAPFWCKVKKRTKKSTHLLLFKLQSICHNLHCNAKKISKKKTHELVEFSFSELNDITKMKTGKKSRFSFSLKHFSFHRHNNSYQQLFFFLSFLLFIRFCLSL